MVAEVPDSQWNGPLDEGPGWPDSAALACPAGVSGPLVAAVRHGYMNYIGEFSCPEACGLLRPGEPVVIQTPRGLELGEVVRRVCSGCEGCLPRDQIKGYVAASGPEYFNFSAGRVLRRATPDDRDEWRRIREETHEKIAYCQAAADQLSLPMKVIECEHLLGGERIVFFFLAEGRIDFRSLVRVLADEYQTRIEMKQVGARDEARLLADYETCGRECCCKNFLKTLKQVNMKMAKMQKATLDPAKVSGRCGRLKCCLRYEHFSYEELDRNLPQINATVTTVAGVVGQVVSRQILTQIVQMQTADGGQVAVPIEELQGYAPIGPRRAAGGSTPAGGSDDADEFVPAADLIGGAEADIVDEAPADAPPAGPRQESGPPAAERIAPDAARGGAAGPETGPAGGRRRGKRRGKPRRRGGPPRG